ncbi:MAG: hypothetical protein OEQ28_12180, partial [Acidobacteriota bacterium]|nr:hypothetical protein [Acidobacteriota bacterium]
PFERETETFAELDIDCWFGPEKSPTLREVTGHTTRIMNADLEIPVILNDDGSLMDGGHRLCRALLEGRKYIKAVQFQEMPKPDKILEL